MSASRIVFLDRETIGPGVALRTPAFDHEWIEHGLTAPDQVAPRIADCDIIVTNKVRIDASALERAPKVKMIAVAATGTDVIDIAACRTRGIVVSNIRGYAVATVPEHTFALILSLARNLPEYRTDVENGRWQESGQFCFFNKPVLDLGGSTLGLVGCGSIGASVGRIGLAFGMRVLFLDAYIAEPPQELERVGSLDDLLRESDFVSCHCPLSPETRGMFGHAQFERMKREAFFVNTARGELVDEAALARAIEGGLIAGAGIDVLGTEPPPLDSPMMRLAARPNVILTPHMAWSGTRARQTLCDQLIENIEGFAAGSPRNLIT